MRIVFLLLFSGFTCLLCRIIPTCFNATNCECVENGQFVRFRCENLIMLNINIRANSFDLSCTHRADKNDTKFKLVPSFNTNYFDSNTLLPIGSCYLPCEFLKISKKFPGISRFAFTIPEPSGMCENFFEKDASINELQFDQFLINSTDKLFKNLKHLETLEIYGFPRKDPISYQLNFTLPRHLIVKKFILFLYQSVIVLPSNFFDESDALEEFIGKFYGVRKFSGTIFRNGLLANKKNLRKVAVDSIHLTDPLTFKPKFGVHLFKNSSNIETICLKNLYLDQIYK